MNKQQKNDLVFIIFSSLPFIFMIFFVLISLITRYILNTHFDLKVTFSGIFGVVLIYTSILAMFDIVSSLRYKFKNAPIQYEKQKKYNSYILLLGFLNVISFFFIGFLFLITIIPSNIG
jgi:hypothetical protein